MAQPMNPLIIFLGQGASGPEKFAREFVQLPLIQKTDRPTSNDLSELADRFVWATGRVSCRFT